MLYFSDANNKLKALYDVGQLHDWLVPHLKVYSLDLLSGWSCPFAKDCLSKVHETGNLTKSGNPQVVLKDGPETEFRCFSASQEVLLPNVYKRRKHNFYTLKNMSSVNDMIGEIDSNLPDDAGILRWHVGGDFFNSKYFFAAINVALMNPTKLFYAYTKSLRYWIQYRDVLPLNFILTASRGGRDDWMIDEHGLRESIVVFSEAEAEEKGLEIDHDDSHAAIPSWQDFSFALLIHGVQPKGSKASKALSALKGKGSYGRKAKV